MIIETKAPIPIEELKKHFTDKEVSYLLDYKTCELKGEKLLTYLSNLDLPCDLKNIDYDLMKDYFHSTSIVNVKELEQWAIDILHVYKNIDTQLYHGPHSKFISENLEIVEKWVKKLDSLSLFNMYIVDEEKFKDYVESHPKDDTNDLEGVNFISILKNTNFFSYYSKVEEKNLTYYTKYFKEYMFRGKNLFEYWANSNNPMFLLTWDTARGNGKEYIELEMLHLFKKIYLATDNIIDVNFDRVVVSDTHGLDVLDVLKSSHGELFAHGKDLIDIIGEDKKYSSIVNMFDTLATKSDETGKRIVIYADDQAFAKVIAHWYKLAFANPDKAACQTLYENAVYRYQVFYKGRFSRNVGNTDLTHTIDTSAFGDAFDNAVIDATEKSNFVTSHKSGFSVEFMLATYFAGKTDVLPDLKNAIKHLMKKDLEKYFYELKEIFWVHFQTTRFTDKLGFSKTYNWSNFKDIENETSKYAQLMLNDRLWKYKYMNFATTGDNINIEAITAEDVTAFEEYTHISGACWGEEEIYKHIKSDINKMAFLDIFDGGIKKDGFTDQRLEDLLEMEAKFENAAGSFFSIDLETVNHYFMQTLILNRTDTEFVSKYSIL